VINIFSIFRRKSETTLVCKLQLEIKTNKNLEKKWKILEKAKIWRKENFGKFWKML
jgi:hypothetical protein